MIHRALNVEIDPFTIFHNDTAYCCCQRIEDGKATIHVANVLEPGLEYSFVPDWDANTEYDNEIDGIILDEIRGRALATTLCNVLDDISELFEALTFLGGKDERFE